MAVVCDALSVVVAVRTLDEKYPGGLEAYQRTVPNNTFCCDGNLTRVGFMTPNDVGYWIAHLEDQGFTFVRGSSNGDPEAIEIAVVDQMTGPTCSAPWIETELVDGTRWAWLASSGRGEEASPPGWTSNVSQSLNFHSNEEAGGMPFLRKFGIDQTLDATDGRVEVVGRPFATVQLYDDAIEHARQEAALGRWDEAYQHYRRAEGYQELEEGDMLVAARVAYRLVLQSHPPRRSLIPEALRRARETTEFGAGADHAGCWYERARLETATRNFSEAKMCIEKSIALNPKDPYSQAERAFIGYHLGEPTDEILARLASALELATSEGIPGVEDYIAHIKAACRITD